MFVFVASGGRWCSAAGIIGLVVLQAEAVCTVACVCAQPRRLKGVRDGLGQFLVDLEASRPVEIGVLKLSVDRWTWKEYHEKVEGQRDGPIVGKMASFHNREVVRS